MYIFQLLRFFIEKIFIDKTKTYVTDELTVEKLSLRRLGGEIHLEIEITVNLCRLHRMLIWVSILMFICYRLGSR